ncbi:hypothetical protein E4U48_007562, partial [Claviceps purpurea]
MAKPIHLKLQTRLSKADFLTANALALIAVTFRRTQELTKFIKSSRRNTRCAILSMGSPPYSCHLHINAAVLIAAAVAVVVAVRAVHIAGISHGQHYVTDSPLNVYLRRTLSRASALHSKTSLAAVGFMPPPSAGTTRSSTTGSKSRSIAPAAHAARAFSLTNSDDE